MRFKLLQFEPKNAHNFIKITTHQLLHVADLIGPMSGSKQLYKRSCLIFSACSRAAEDSSVCDICVVE